MRARFGTESLSGKGCAVSHATVLTRPESRSDGSLSLWERAGVRARLGTESSVEKAAPFSALRCHGRDRPAPPSKPDDGAVRPLDSPRGNLLSSPPGTSRRPLRSVAGEGGVRARHRSVKIMDLTLISEASGPKVRARTSMLETIHPAQVPTTRQRGQRQYALTFLLSAMCLGK